MKMKQLNRLLLFITILSLHQTTSLAIAHYFPNISSLPPPSQLPNITTDNLWTKLFQQLTNAHLGDTVLGLSNLKSYLFHFGYITNSSAETFTDDFDSDLESAIKSYQLNFNLNITGILDDPTLRQIQRPRCGNADVINGTSTMKKNTSTTNHLNTVAHYSFFPNSPRWPEDRRDLTYAFLPANQLEESAKQIFARAFDSWAAVIPMTFTRIETYSAADIRIGFFTTDHGDGEPFDGVLGVLAHAFSPPFGKFHLDGDEYWVDGATALDPSAFDLESVAVHEIGHLLGLGHSSVEEAIMYPSISGGMRKVELAADDVEGVQVLYGSKTTTNGSTTATPTQQRDTNGGCGVTRGVNLLVLCLLSVVGCWIAA